VDALYPWMHLVGRTLFAMIFAGSGISHFTQRGGKVYVDYLQNHHGQLMAAPFSAREKPGATVSTPLLWNEVGEGLSIGDYTIETVPPRMKTLEGGDPMAPVLTESPDLIAALEKLMAKVR